jgi:hypothetical protein
MQATSLVKQPVEVDLFVGAGGLSCGVETASFDAGIKSDHGCHTTARPNSTLLSTEELFTLTKLRGDRQIGNAVVV